MSTAIEWVRNADGSQGKTWNPTVGCDRVSPGCAACYAMGVAHRKMQAAHEGLTEVTEHGVDWTGLVRCLPERLDIPTKVKKSTTWFVDSMSDLFHPDVLAVVHEPSGAPFLAEVFATMAATPRHTYQVLTKRPALMARVLTHPMFRMDVNACLLRRSVPVMGGGFESPWPSNIWLGTSIESDPYVWRANHLRNTPAAVRFLSLEPLLGPLPDLDLTGIDWVIVGGESGPHPRPMHPQWARDLRDRCIDAEIHFTFKQWGAWAPVIDQPSEGDSILSIDGALRDWSPDRDGFIGRAGEGFRTGTTDVIVRKFSKHGAGRLLDGLVWDGMPERHA